MPEKAAPPDPSAWWLSLEQSRALWELWQFLEAAPALLAAPRGDGRPVLVVPGLLATDDSTAVLRHYLRRLGHSPEPWTLGPNLGPTDRILSGLERRVADSAAAHGRRVALVGVSLGGLFARDLARRSPHWVSQVITLGSPFSIRDRRQSHVSAAYDALSPLHVDASRFSVWQAPRAPLPVPSTAIYTRTDGVVAWQTCVDELSPVAENIEVIGSHTGLAHLPTAAYAIADRLSQPDRSWRRFVPPPGLRHLYPCPCECGD